MKFKAAMPEVPKLVGGALIAVGVGGITATIADAVHSTPLIIAVWLIALVVGIVSIFYVEQKKRQMMLGAETTILPVVDAQGTAHERPGHAGSQVIRNTDSEDPQLSDEMATRVDLESRSPWDTTPTSEIYVVPPSHRRLLNAQSDGDFLVWSPNYPAAETERENEPRVLRLPPGKWLHIGRSPRSDIQFTGKHTPISRRHAVVKLTEPGILLVRDLGSLNGTWVNGESVDAYCRHNGVKAMPVRADADIVVAGVPISYGWRSKR